MYNQSKCRCRLLLLDIIPVLHNHDNYGHLILTTIVVVFFILEINSSVYYSIYIYYLYTNLRKSAKNIFSNLL